MGSAVAPAPRVRLRVDEDLEPCVGALRSVHEADGYRTWWPADPAPGWTRLGACRLGRRVVARRDADRTTPDGRRHRVRVDLAPEVGGASGVGRLAAGLR